MMSDVPPPNSTRSWEKKDIQKLMFSLVNSATSLTSTVGSTHWWPQIFLFVIRSLNKPGGLCKTYICKEHITVKAFLFSNRRNTTDSPERWIPRTIARGRPFPQRDPSLRSDSILRRSECFGGFSLSSNSPSQSLLLSSFSLCGLCLLYDPALIATSLGRVWQCEGKLLCTRSPSPHG